MKVQFHKYHGLGNDFILIADGDGTIRPQMDLEQIRRLCDRHTGIGADGAIFCTASEIADHRMILFNADGSPAEISGNGLRCFVLFLKALGHRVDDDFQIETGGGVMRARRLSEQTVETTMPLPTFAGNGHRLDPFKATVDGETFSIFPVTVGNPHGVIFGPQRDIEFAKKYGPKLERHERFPEGANIEFVHVLNEHACKLVVWERGAGITMACGSGSVATAAAGCALGLFEFDTPIAIEQPGGQLFITVSSKYKEIRQRGPAEFVFSGEFEL